MPMPLISIPHDPLQQLHLDQKAMPRSLKWTDSELLSHCGFHDSHDCSCEVHLTPGIQRKCPSRTCAILKNTGNWKTFEHLILWVLKTLIWWKMCNTIYTFSGPAASYDIFKSTSCCAAPPWFIYHRSWIVIWVQAFAREVVLEFHLSILTRPCFLVLSTLKMVTT